MPRSSEFFAAGGILSRRIPGFAYRPCQEGMAELVEKALSSSCHAVVEAGTGTGKSYAYIVPLMLRAAEGLGKEIIATSTMPLMGQLLRKDIPQMLDALSLDLDVAALYGRGNYLCALKWDYLYQSRKDDDGVRRFAGWVDGTETGLRDEIADPSLYPLFAECAAERESCIGRFCPYISQCFYYRARKRAEEADIIVTNHHVVLSDIMLRREKGSGSDEAVLLPPFDAMAIDEAHNFPDGATDTFTSTFSTRDARHVLKAIADRRAGKGQCLIDALSPCLKDRAAYGEISSMVAEIREMAEDFDVRIRSLLGRRGRSGERIAFDARFYEENRFAARSFAPLAGRLSDLGSLLASSFMAPEDAGEETWGDMRTLSFAAERLSELGTLLERWIGFSYPADEIPYGVEEGGTLYISFAPMDTGRILAESFLDNGSPMIFSSATLSVGGSFDFFASQVGLDICETGYISSCFPTSFDLGRNLLCLVARGGMSYSNEEKGSWEEGLAQPIADAIRASGGGALVLFTSRSSMENVYPKVKALLPGMSVLMQESGRSRNMLLKAFKEDEDSSLFALSSFWEGIDAPGETLRLLIIPKLPYPVPTDPIIAARGEMLAERTGRSAFMEQAVPLCALKMKQGIGRVIRGEKDRGAVLILDQRIMKPMSRKILASFPECHMETDVPLAMVPGRLRGFYGIEKPEHP